MLEKDMFDSWKSRMELYMLNRKHGWMILESVESGPLLWTSIEENEGDDLIDAINHMISFLTSVVTTNNQLRTSSNPRQQATINNGREKVLVITTLKETLSKLKGKDVVNEALHLHSIDPELLKIDVTPLAPKLHNNRTAHTDYLRHIQEETTTLREIVERRQNSMTAGSSRPYASGSSETSGKQRVSVCYNCKGEGHMSKQCTKPKRRRDEQWFKDKIALMANLSHYGSDNLAESLEIEKLKHTLSEHLKEKKSLEQKRNNSFSEQSASTFAELFEINDLKAQSQEKDTVIVKLKERLQSLSRNIEEKKVKRKLEEIEMINVELDHRVTKLVAENEHLKQTYKQLYDSITSSRVRSKEQCDDLNKQVNLKSAEVSDLNASL
nr:hypothetical protein [Tanacetum cinerariifolium]